MAIGNPRVGQVIRYSFLWSTGEEKDRPVIVVVVATHLEDSGKYRVTVMPITHRLPVDTSAAIEIPKQLKNTLKLDTEKSWVIVDEVNDFEWPGYDLRPIPGSKKKWEYGQLPGKFYDLIINRFMTLGQSRRLTVIIRDS